MGKIKGCSNESCEAHKKKIKYKESEVSCLKCKGSLVYVCKDCYTQLPNDTVKYCVRCLAKHEDRKAKTKKVVAGLGGALALGILTFGNKAIDAAKKSKD